MYGTLRLLDTWNAQNKSIIQTGEQSVYDDLLQALAAHNTIVKQQMIPELADMTTERFMAFGQTTRVRMERGSEDGMPDVQKVGGRANLGFRLERHRAALGWTRDFMLTHTPRQLFIQYAAFQEADLDEMQKEIQRAIFHPFDNLTYQDHLWDFATLPLMALHNADGFPVRNALDGSTFDPTVHTHYTANATLDATALRTVITNVVEHGVRGEIRLYISRSQETAIRAISGFYPINDQRLIQSVNQTVVDPNQVGALDINNLVNRPIGIFEQAVIWVKPWVLNNYLVAVDTGAPGEKALAWRTRPDGLYQDLTLVADFEHFPLRAQTIQRDFGVTPWHRHMIAVHYTGGGSYVEPTITSR